jgi:hypothetical protein
VSSVLQPWVESLSLKKQTVLIGVIRAPDTVFTLNLKRVTVWQRAVILIDADPMTGFMHKALCDLPLFEQIDREFERLPLHAAHHILLGMQVIAYEWALAQDKSNSHGPDYGSMARKFYDDAVRAQHLHPEPRAEYEARMTDNPVRIESGTS